jgi:hypothetical protein
MPMEFVSLGTALSVLKSVAASAIKWTWDQVNRPWTEVLIRAAIRRSNGSWHRVGFKCVNEKPYELEVLSVHTVKPKDLPLRPSDRTPQQGMVLKEPVTTLTNLNWTIAEKGAVSLPWECVVYVDLADQADELSVDFEFKVRLLDNRRKERRVRVRTNVVKQA